jgi:alanine dehydrogenase
LRIGIPRETKQGERRVSLLPADVARVAAEGHEVRVEREAGAGVGAPDDEYVRAGATLSTTGEAWDCDLVVKVKELLDWDFAHAKRGRAVFAFQQLPGAPTKTQAVAQLGLTAIAFELVRDARGRFPLLAPMSVISGRMAVEAVWRFVPSRDARVLVLGAGNAGLSAARAARGRGAQVLLLTRSAASRDAARADGFQADLATPAHIEDAALQSDLVVGAVLRHGEPTPKLVPRALVRRMKRGAAIADVCIDGGGVAETSRPTSHGDPTYVEEGVVHYAVPNIPGADPVAATAALSLAVRPYVERIASRGLEGAMREDAGLRAGVYVWKGRVAHRGIAEESGLPYTALSEEELA